MAQKTKSRGNSEGSVFFNKEKQKWVVQVTVGNDPETGILKRDTKYCSTQKEALAVRKELVEKYSHNISFDANKITVKEWLDKWFEVYKIPKLRENTQVSYKSVIDICIKAIGNMKLEKVQTIDLQNIIFHKIGKDHYRTCQYFRTVIKQAFERARRDHLIVDNPAEFLELPSKPPKKKFVKPTKETWKALLGYNAGFYGWKLAIFTVFITGLRRSELLALTWDSFKLEKDENGVLFGHVTIDKAMGIGNKDEKTGRRNVYIDRTKSATSVRSLYLPPPYCRELLKYRKEQNILRLASKKWEHPEMVFTTNDGRYYNPDVFSSLYSRVCRELDIKTTFHMLRHDMATSMKSSHRLDFKDIQSQLGHSNIQITLDTYTHMQEEDVAAIDQFLDERFDDII
ncbi:tyrosine-type recombinase/integrase [Anaerovibrio lipolyticus]|uniref:tyrosine-type recombinase/integrase n=1 Tax=Anaerovibrio lipolyticus TaxID=82374 RepID=UPI000483BF19|nr:tyrosine-type recombinase/integrase [Anaerovibrio lipolyticus]